jgi:two-component system response regulator HydG
MSRRMGLEKAKVLIVDDEESMRNFMEIMLSKEGYEVLCAGSGADAVQVVGRERPEIVIADLMMPNMSGLELLSEIKGIDEKIEVIVMTAFASVDTALDAMKRGAYDYITKPFKIDEIKLTLKKLAHQTSMQEENQGLRSTLSSEFSFDNFIGKNLKVLKMKEMAKTVAGTDSTVLIRGESGTGTDLIAKAIHYHSDRAGKPFLTLNCAALPETLLESELFGYVKGAFTGALKDKDGLLKAADTGTFFLDEIGNTSPAIQVKLLRVLEEKKITPVGSTQSQAVDVRLIAATNANLEAEVESGRFRADLFYRLNVLPIYIPSLRERKEDIELLVDHFLDAHASKMKCRRKSVDPNALQALIKHDWPGNVRELENTIERAVILSRGDVLGSNEFPSEVIEGHSDAGNVPETESGTPTLESIEKAYIYWTLNQTEWQKAKAARLLGIDPSTLYRKIQKYGLEQARK